MQTLSREEYADCVQCCFSEPPACKALARSKAVPSAFLRLQTLACWRTVRGQLGWAIPFKLLNDASQFVAPIFINLLLDVVESGKPPSVGYTLACLMFLGLMIGTLADNQHFQRTMRAGLPLSLASSQSLTVLRFTSRQSDKQTL